jgi:hypothetical protein
MEGVGKRVRIIRLQDASLTLRTPPTRHLLPCHPLRASLGQVLPLRNQTLMEGAGEQGDAVLPDLVAEVLAGDADRPRAGWFEDIPLQVIPLFWVGQVTGNGHRSAASTPVLVAARGGGQVSWALAQSSLESLSSAHRVL